MTQVNFNGGVDSLTGMPSGQPIRTQEGTIPPTANSEEQQENPIQKAMLELQKNYPAQIKTLAGGGRVVNYDGPTVQGNGDTQRIISAEQQRKASKALLASMDETNCVTGLPNPPKSPI